MKMKDVFELPLRTIPGGNLPCVVDKNGGILTVIDKDRSDAIAIALNMHDEMCEIVDSLKSAVEFAVDDLQCAGHDGDALMSLVREADRILAKAKGEL